MKYVVILPDGVSDVPIEALGGKTPLEVAKHPHLDRIAREGITGWVKTIPDGFTPGSDVGCMSVLGYDPRTYYTGRAPLEAAAQGIVLREGDVAFRCNTVTISRDDAYVMKDYSAGHIPTADSAGIINDMNEKFQSTGIRFISGVGYRHLALISDEKFRATQCTPPHNISGKSIRDYWPTGEGAEFLKAVMKTSAEYLRDHPINKRLQGEGKNPANMLWLWGQGTAAKLPSFRQTYGVRGACISAVDIVRGLGTLVGFDILKVPGITGYFDTNYEGKAEFALKALEDHDLVLIHVEATDEAGHIGDWQKKIQAIEDTDRRLVGPLLEGLARRGEPAAVLVVCDHPTSTVLKTHIAEPVPFAIRAPGATPDAVAAYSESAVRGATVRLEDGFTLMRLFLDQGKTTW